jgi:hypothetical protein
MRDVWWYREDADEVHDDRTRGGRGGWSGVKSPTDRENWCVCVGRKERKGMGGVGLCTRRGFASRLRSVLRSRCRYSFAENASPKPFDAGTVLPFE